jgi:hypothetical protein
VTSSSQSRPMLGAVVTVLVACSGRRIEPLSAAVHRDAAPMDRINAGLDGNADAQDDKDGCRYFLRVVKPDPSIDFKLVVIEPDPNTKFFLRVLDADGHEVDSESNSPLATGLRPRLKVSLGGPPVMRERAASGSAEADAQKTGK